jgi:hypothetical protein
VQGVMTKRNGRIRVEFSMPWYMRLTSLPFLAGGLYFTYYSGQILRQDLFGYGHWRDDWVGLAMCLVFALVVGLPGLVLLTLRYFVDLDRILQQVIVTKKFGPVKFASLRKLTEFKFLSITDDTNSDDDGCITRELLQRNLGSTFRRSEATSGCERFRWVSGTDTPARRLKHAGLRASLEAIVTIGSFAHLTARPMTTSRDGWADGSRRTPITTGSSS